ncbi:MAG: hypothetical protein WD894_01385 [Pirellulales bacterium]
MKTKAMSVARCLVMAWVPVAFFDARVALGQEAKAAAEGKDETQESANKRRLAEMRRLADTIQVTVGQGDESKEAKLIEKPLFRFSDPRLYSDGSVWAWAIAGRPVMMVEFRTHFRNESVWAHDVVATSDVRVLAQIADRGKWAPQEPDLKLLPVSDLGVPARSEAGRLRQMKHFADSLNATKVWETQRAELRLLPTEIYRYSDAKSGLVDGAAFAFAEDNNPEAILFVEAHKSDMGPGAPESWKYGLARMSAAALTFRLGDSDIWSVPRSFGGPRETYYVFTRTVPAARGPDDDYLK